MTSIIKVDNLQNQCGANIINENAGTITIGASGDTITLAAGASQSGFGRSGSVNWDTTPKTTGFTAVSGNGYFCDTTSAAFTVTLPATPAAGDIVAIADYNGSAEQIILQLQEMDLILMVDASDGYNFKSRFSSNFCICRCNSRIGQVFKLQTLMILQIQDL
jgi:hypothetical protein